MINKTNLGFVIDFGKKIFLVYGLGTKGIIN